MRLPFIVQVEVTWKGGTSSGYSTDLSVKGVFVKMDEVIPAGEEVRLEFAVFSQLEKLPVVVIGDVIRVVTPEESAITGEVSGFGLEFRSLEEGRSELFQFLGQRLEAIQEPLPPTPGAEVPLPSTEDEGLRVHWGTSPDLDNNGKLYDIEKRGSFFLETPVPAPIGSHAYLWFSLPLAPKAMPVKATATVTHVAGDNASRRGMVVRIELATLDIHIIERFFQVRSRPAVSESQPRKSKDDEFYRSLGLPLPKRIPVDKAGAGDAMASSGQRGSRTTMIAGAAAILLIFLFLWLVF